MLSQRKMAIAMYGYGWLKPAGCAKTMLGRREEEVEREEVERQLRDVEMQERAAQEAEEQERQARLAERGEPEEGRDLDEDIPDMDVEGMEDEGDEDEDQVDLDGEIPDMDGDDDGMGGDLDDDIPDADEDENDDDDEDVMSPDPDGIDSNWVYDSRREPDTDDEMLQAHASSPGNRARRSGRFRHGTAIVAGVRVPVPGSEYDYDEREAEDLANAMLDEDEIFDHEDDEEMAERDLDDDVPEAAESEQAWEHTDTELEDSEMDISMLAPSVAGAGHISGIRPPQSRMSGAGPRRSDIRQSSGNAQQRRSSGPWINEPSPALPHPAMSSSSRPGPIFDRRQMHQHQQHQQPQFPQSTAPRARMVSGNRRQYLHTPDTPDFSPLSHGSDGAQDDDEEDDEEDLIDPFNSSDAPRTQPYAHRRPQHPYHASHPLPAATAGAHHLSQPSNFLDGQAGENPTSRTGSTSSTRNAARSWLDGAAAAVVGGGARRTLFGRAARRGYEGGAGAGAADAGASRGGGGSRAASGGASSGGLFTPEPVAGGSGSGGERAGAGGAGGAGVRAWDDTPVTHGADQQQTRQHQRRRSGRFLAGRRRGS